ncbi:YbjN domain-containing protein [Deinococcus sp. QL22]|uniref:YbjN domain-containing protein n=1 Tax=Deinococcus sp. QL22 TaxID=2939437 RepID=UPI0020177084|nr:YbjN domain-containing protein [Deinococcus sp. QL22]UQN05268.1 YbjN domain-containing protein [Deinococcus sp. QL22]
MKTKPVNKVLLSAALLLTSALGVASAGGAAAPTVGGSTGQIQAATPNSVAAALREAGYKVTVNPANPDEDPSLSVTAGDYEIDVWFSNCKGNVCTRVTASSYWDYSDDEDALDVELTNEWNGNYYTQAYIYEGSYYLDTTMVIAGGYTKTALKAWMTEYLDDVSTFEESLDEE